MTGLVSFTIDGERLVLSPDRALYWENERTLIVADLHIGKTGHFRKSGIGIPSSVYKDDLHRLIALILFFKAEKLIIVGDLSHSVANKELELFRKWRKDFPLMSVHLAKGNHDILGAKWYQETDIEVHVEPLAIKNFLFVHDMIGQKIEEEPGKFYFSGHVHPAVGLKGRGRQSLVFPCYYFTENGCVLPAFSRFTGNYMVRPSIGETAFAIIEKELVKIEGR